MARKTSEITVKRCLYNTSTDTLTTIEDMAEKEQEEVFSELYLTFINSFLAKEGYRAELEAHNPTAG